MAEEATGGFLDTNVLVYAVGADGPRKHQAKALLGALSEITVSAQVISEFTHVCVRKHILTPEATRRAARLYLNQFRLVPISEAVLRRGLDLHERYGYSWWDSLILSAALEARCTVLYSEDMQHGQEVEGLRIENPFTTTA